MNHSFKKKKKRNKSNLPIILIEAGRKKLFICELYLDPGVSGFWHSCCVHLSTEGQEMRERAAASSNTLTPTKISLLGISVPLNQADSEANFALSQTFLFQLAAKSQLCCCFRCVLKCRTPLMIHTPCTFLIPYSLFLIPYSLFLFYFMCSAKQWSSSSEKAQL